MDYDLATLLAMKDAAEMQLMAFLDGTEAMTIEELDTIENEIASLNEKIEQFKK